MQRKSGTYLIYLLTAIVSFQAGLLPASAQKSSPEEYIERYNGLAVSQMKDSGIPASITLAQGGLESGWGGSELARTAFNHFGIKCHGWSGRGYTMKSGGDRDCYRRYASVEESFQDHSDFLRYRERYAFLFTLDPSDYRGWAQGLQKAGYSTNPQYASLLINIIERYSLYRYDSGMKPGKRAGTVAAAPVRDLPAAEAKVLEKSIYYKYSRGRTIYETNGVPFILSSEGDTYESIAEEYGLFTKEVLSFNDLRRHEGTILPGTRVYLHRKKKASSGTGVYVAVPGDTYYGISQMYGVRLDSILKYNGVKDRNLLRVGDSVRLHRNKRK